MDSWGILFSALGYKKQSRSMKVKVTPLGSNDIALLCECFLSCFPTKAEKESEVNGTIVPIRALWELCESIPPDLFPLGLKFKVFKTIFDEVHWSLLQAPDQLKHMVWVYLLCIVD